MNKQKLINDIQQIIVDCGEFNFSEVNNKTDIVISTIGHSIEFVESVDINGISTIITVDGHVIDYDYYIYEYLTESILEEIYNICEEYQTQCEKTLKRSKN